MNHFEAISLAINPSYLLKPITLGLNTTHGLISPEPKNAGGHHSKPASPEPKNVDGYFCKKKVHPGRKLSCFPGRLASPRPRWATASSSATVAKRGDLEAGDHRPSGSELCLGGALGRRVPNSHPAAELDDGCAASGCALDEGGVVLPWNPWGGGGSGADRAVVMPVGPVVHDEVRQTWKTNTG